jgi:hypothetical protein
VKQLRAKRYRTRVDTSRSAKRVHPWDTAISLPLTGNYRLTFEGGFTFKRRDFHYKFYLESRYYHAPSQRRAHATSANQRRNPILTTADINVRLVAVQSHACKSDELCVVDRSTTGQQSPTRATSSLLSMTVPRAVQRP